ncbi:MAG: Uma2 family endonuclease [Microcoleus sp. PH2017_10_PVI_O_A]|uniref:Uma2 family endonuclease n=1 Tax=unclassified Microcoleus TaxID=2642155 RepID=UPI001DF3675A|nr:MULTISPECIES: Uma2 family endonuclease [unclassified Microcoleus]TAE78505.1 MAG: Uma2 family endonuclease [Oscillatoriales cyanobacterium]MCC3408202.1 Uma2 family endonuclease [Microcoleus sp. PH2017_10_PVI_O_A]MCC3462892.1 Uma2 family endonuclease [Microcoleus sp. PH2017_11_PCY_U_A]MCC3480747.1 Uma2 family endonuclease [Microcoleus sp. PH2017_12_PCY_D_A]MCC3530673.1 Uma2 family endonuclease [Microcoleus sp. PH2017_21_RUC_O_A]
MIAKISFDQFLVECPEDGLYELVNGEIIEIFPTRNHIDVADCILTSFHAQIKNLSLNYVVTSKTAIRSVTKSGVEQGRRPDVSVIDRDLWYSDRSAYAAMREPIQLAVEVASMNWNVDYIHKLDEYQRLGIAEYWVVDYLAIASSKFIGKPKVATVFVHLLDAGGNYQTTAFKGSDRIVSRTFPELTLTAEQVLYA